MASRKNPFGKAHFEKMALTKTTEKRIRALYSSVAQEIQQRLDTLQLINPSDSLKKAYLESLQRDVSKSIDSLNRMVEQTIKDSGEMSGNIAVNAGNRMMQEVGLTISGAYSYVPRQEVENIVSGNLYGRGWNLSQAIWKSGSKVKSDVENIVAKGLVENKPIKAIADDLMTHVDPTARKPWDWNKVYPGTAAKVDYNAQRLARTMIQHSFQQSLVQSQRYNPFCRGIIWWSVGLHGRTCAECLDRDGQLFSPATLPLDHPNGLCYFEPQLVPMDQIADELADWTMGAENAAIDRYVTKGLGLQVGSAAAKKATDNVKSQVVVKKATRRRLKAKTPKSDFVASDYVDANFTNMRKKIVMSQKTKEQGEEVWQALREHLIKLEEDQLRYLQTGEKKLKAILPGDRAYFRPEKNTITLDLYKDMQNVHGKGQFTTFFHEYGHLLDHNAVGPKHKYYFSQGKEFRERLYSSLEKEYNKLCKDGVLRADVRKDLIKGSGSNGVQDIISGLSLNKNRVVWGHPTDYWKTKGQIEGVTMETMAHFNAAWANPQAEAYMRKYFPDSYQLIKDEVLNYIKKGGKK